MKQLSIITPIHGSDDATGYFMCACDSHVPVTITWANGGIVKTPCCGSTYECYDLKRLARRIPDYLVQRRPDLYAPITHTTS